MGSDGRDGTGNGAVEMVGRAVAESGLAAYCWDIASDALTWSPGAAEVLRCDPALLDTGQRFAAFLDPENLTSRYDTVMSGGADYGAGVPFRIEYRFLPGGRKGRQSLWLEDQGRWHAGADGRPARAFGTLRRIDERFQQDQHLSFLGHCDPLTGMMNRGRMMEALGGALLSGQREGTSCAFLVAAVTNLSIVNEAYGFEVADEVIVNVSRRLARVVRAGDALSRYSGSKFGFVLHDCGEDDLKVAAERFLSAARASVIETAHGPVWALLSIGAVVLPRDAADPATAIARAEEALAEARKLPADGVVIYHPSEELRSQRSGNARHATEIVRCLKEGGFQLAFQPVVDARTGVPEFHEALLRMTAQDGRLVTAGHLIPIAEKLGLVRLIDRAVAEMAVAIMLRHPAARLSLNMSGTTATDPRWYPEIIAILKAEPQLAPRLTIEITETVALGDLSHTIRFVEQLRELGCSVAIDDFGAGYTSFRSLRALPIQYLKLDGTFCAGLSGNSDNQYYARSLIDIARTFDIRTVAEWVETEEDAALLRGWGVDLMQGKLYGMAELTPPWPEAAADLEPPPAAETLRWFESGLEDELARLRRAITLLDRAFADPAARALLAEPSFADLVSETAGARAR